MDGAPSQSDARISDNKIVRHEGVARDVKAAAGTHGLTIGSSHCTSFVSIAAIIARSVVLLCFALGICIRIV
jgi:hypothetical protein